MRYTFESRYIINTTPEILWEIMTDVESWPEKLKYFRKVSIVGIEKNLKIGTLIHCRVRGIIPYTFNFQTEIIKINQCRELEVKSSGDLNGKGRWTINRDENRTVSTFSWDVTTENFFLKTIETLPFGRKLLSFSHNFIMNSGYRSLVRLLAKDIGTQP
ncbi:MAG TPA: hypothetical protein PK906_04185 [Spirochaetota bacterium]|nr:hypothetical protein [Spirochaetota bacterium]